MSLRTTPITLVTCVVLVIGLILDAVSTSASASLVLVPYLVIDHGQIWRLVTFPMVPGSLMHFLIATVTLLWVGRRLELRIGRWRYLMLCVLPSLAAAVTYLCLPDPSGMKPPLASPNFISSGILLAALVLALALRHINFKSWKTWVVGLFVAYYLFAIIVAPLDILAMNVIAFLVAGVLVFRQVRDARAA